MTRFQKVQTFIYGIMNVATAVVMMFYPKEAYSYVLIFMATGFILSGISTLV